MTADKLVNSGGEKCIRDVPKTQLHPTLLAPEKQTKQAEQAKASGEKTEEKRRRLLFVQIHLR